jgi:hypothetical protein
VLPITLEEIADDKTDRQTDGRTSEKKRPAVENFEIFFKIPDSSRVLRGSFEGPSGVLRGSFEGSSRVLRGSFEGPSRVLRGFFEGPSRVLRGSCPSTSSQRHTAQTRALDQTDISA